MSPAARKRSARRTSKSDYADVIAALDEIERGKGQGAIEVDGHTLKVSSLGKPYFPEVGFTKGDAMRYYARVAPLMLPRITDRPLALDRYPDGVGGNSFYQQKAPDHLPEGVRTGTVRDLKGDDVQRLVGGSLLTQLYTVQIGTIPVHPWHSRIGALASADYIVIDLDPGPDVKFPRIVEAALWVGAVLDEMKLRGAPKTSGSRGIHVYIFFSTRTSIAKAAAISEEIAQRVVDAHPRTTTLERSIAKRPTNAIYVDHLQNGLGKTVVAPYSLRAKPGATVSTPLRWDELVPSLDASAFTLATVPARIADLGDVWA